MMMTPRAQKTQRQMLPFLEPVGTVVDPLDDAVVCSAVTVDPHNLLFHLHVCDHALPALSSPTNPHKYLFRGQIAIALWGWPLRYTSIISTKPLVTVESSLSGPAIAARAATRGSRPSAISRPAAMSTRVDATSRSPAVSSRRMARANRTSSPARSGPTPDSHATTFSSTSTGGKSNSIETIRWRVESLRSFSTLW